MAIRNIRQEGDEILKKKSREVEVIDERVKELIEDMVETKYSFLNLFDQKKILRSRVFYLYLKNAIAHFSFPIVYIKRLNI